MQRFSACVEVEVGFGKRVGACVHTRRSKLSLVSLGLCGDDEFSSFDSVPGLAVQPQPALDPLLEFSSVHHLPGRRQEGNETRDEADYADR